MACAPIGKAVTTFWDGAIEAEQALPTSIPRPRLRSWHDWNDREWQYRAELYDHLSDPPASATPILSATLNLPPSWWAGLRVALNDIAAVPTRRLTVHQGFLDHAMPRLLGTPISTSSPGAWVSAHGDLHFANVCTPTLRLFDFEGWGLAPPGYDAAMLHSHSLLIPSATAQVRHELAPILNTASGRFAELVVIAELLHAATRGHCQSLAEPLVQRAGRLLGRTVLLPATIRKDA
ncbi:hypothetical protein E1264_37425 [Actinomadura sp. KC216]|nr:hypothetical protein E1264_37425 [Actinomadura sp. KC216]